MSDFYDPITGELLEPGTERADDNIWTRPLGWHAPAPRMNPTPWRIRELRKMPYPEYLNSPEWQNTRRHILYRARNKCERCLRGHQTLHVHHRTYERLGHEHADDLEALCEACHRLEHDKESVA